MTYPFFLEWIMKQISHILSSWWFSTMILIRTPPTTIQERETLRKRRLLTIILLISFLAQAPIWVLGAFNGETTFQHIVNTIQCSSMLLALWINRRGYLKSASLVYLLPAIFGAAVSIYNQSGQIPVLSFCMWSILLPIAITAGLFLPVWGSFLTAAIEIAFMNWFVLVARPNLIITYLGGDPAKQITFLVFTCMIITITAIFCAISTATTGKAIIQADRAVELEVAHHTIAEAYTKLEIAHATIQKQALTDGLTGLPNHRSVMDQFSKELYRTRRYERPLSVLFFDADHFKRVNDTYGHAVGDAVLCQIGQRTGNLIRGSDLLGRFGGEEFVILLPETGAKEANEVAERLRAVVAAEPMAFSEVEGGINMTLSIGLSTYPTDGSTEQELLSQADEAMYLAKRLGRNQVRIAKEARQVKTDIDLLALLEQEGQKDSAKREGVTPEQMREQYMVKIINWMLSSLERHDKRLSMSAHRVSDLAISTAQMMGLEPKEVSRIGMAALLHNVGKLAIPDRLLQKADQLSSEDHTQLQDYAELGGEILEISPFLSDLAPAVRHHKERWDGHGYPDHLQGEHIPLAARIIAVAETYNSMEGEYPYQASSISKEMIAKLQQGAGVQFDPRVVQAFTEMLFASQKKQQSLQMVGREQQER